MTRAASALAALLVLTPGLASAAPPAVVTERPADPPQVEVEMPPNTDPHKRLPEEIVRARVKAGADVGWLRADPTAGSVLFVAIDDGKPGDLPAFDFTRIKGIERTKLPDLAKLPPPDSAYGLQLDGLVRDAQLKQLAGLRNLRALSFQFTELSDVG